MLPPNGPRHSIGWACCSVNGRWKPRLRRNTSALASSPSLTEGAGPRSSGLKANSSSYSGPSTDRGGRTAFEELFGKFFLIQRFFNDQPAAPDGIAIIGAGPDAETFAQ